MGKEMMSIDVFRQSIIASDLVLKPYGVNLFDFLMEKGDPSKDLIYSAVGITSIQVYTMKKLLVWIFEPITA